MPTNKKNAKDHRSRKNPRMHEQWIKQKKARNAAQRAARKGGANMYELICPACAEEIEFLGDYFVTCVNPECPEFEIEYNIYEGSTDED